MCFVPLFSLSELNPQAWVDSATLQESLNANDGQMGGYPQRPRQAAEKVRVAQFPTELASVAGCLLATEAGRQEVNPPPSSPRWLGA